MRAVGVCPGLHRPHHEGATHVEVLPADRRSLAVVAAAAVLALAAGGGAVAGSLITSKDIQDKTITGADLHKNAVKTQKVKDGTLKIQDLTRGPRTH